MNKGFSFSPNLALQRTPQPPSKWGMNLRSLFCLCLGSLLTICGMNNSQAAPEPTRIACLGDSITAGYKVTPQTRWTTLLGKKLGDHYTVLNFGISARCLLDSGDRPIRKEKIYKDALASNPDVVLIGLGTNDSKMINWAHKDQFADNYKDIIDEFKKANPDVKVFCLLCIPSQEPGEDGISQERIEKEVNPLITQVAKETKSQVIDLYSVMKSKKKLLTDGVHPDDKGHAIMADAVAKALKKSLKK